MKATNNTARLINQFSGQATGLAIQFILGISLTTLVEYNPDNPTVVQTVLLTAHIVIALLLFIGATTIVIAARRLGNLQGLSILGLVAVIAAIGSGAIAAGREADVAVFLMALFFMVAIWIYGYGVVRLSKS